MICTTNHVMSVRRVTYIYNQKLSSPVIPAVLISSDIFYWYWLANEAVGLGYG